MMEGETFAGVMSASLFLIVMILSILALQGKDHES